MVILGLPRPTVRAYPNGPRAYPEQDSDSRCVARGSAQLRQPRALHPRVPGADPRGGERPAGIPAGALAVPRHPEHQPGRVLHDPRGGPQAAAFGSRRGDGARRHDACGATAGGLQALPRARRTAGSCAPRGDAARLAARRRPLSLGPPLARIRSCGRSLLPAGSSSRAHAARARSGPSLSPPAQQVAERRHPLRRKAWRPAPLRRGAGALYWQRRPLALSEFFAGVAARPEIMQLHDEPFTPVVPSALGDGGSDLIAAVRERDVLLHHPYESFEPVVSFIETAADDPDVLAIKMTLYRTEPGSPIVRALQRAAENGKQVTALVELKARMDEEANILWARELERSGVHVVYGLIGFKTHCKLAMLVRREGTSLRRYVHLGTGNYNTNTARSYSDLSLFTSQDDFTADATSLFNLLTGYSKPDRWRKFLVSPLGLKQSILQLIEDEIRAGAEGRIVAKMNALADRDVVKALYRASNAGVQVDLLIRGICCLRPSVPGLSERIRVTSVVDRFLEHARVWYFHGRGEKKLYLASGDWMQRNFVRRVDVAFPIEAPELKERILSEILGTMVADTAKARVLRPDGTYERIQPAAGGAPVRSQEQFMALARRAAFSDASRSPTVEPLLAAAGKTEPRQK